MLQLFYNAYHPIEILDSLTVKSSVCCKWDRGVSMASQMINSHGPFTFVFKSDRDWYELFTEVQYDGVSALDFFRGKNPSLKEYWQYPSLHKIEEFRDEHEWWAPGSIHFQLDDVQRVVFREKSPGAKIHPIIAKRNYKKLRERFSLLISV